MTKASSITILVLVVAGSGCLFAHENSGERGWGLGLDIGNTLPPPAPFAEEAAEVVKLAQFNNETAPVLLARCGLDGSNHSFGSRTAFGAFADLSKLCRDIADAQGDEAGRAALKNGTLYETLSEYSDRANNSLEQLRASLKAMPSPGTYLDAAVQGGLVEDFQGLLLTRRDTGFPHGINPKWNDAESRTTLFTGSMADLISQAAALQYLANHYPWTAGTCDLPSLERETAKVRPMQQHALALAYKYGFTPTPNGENIGYRYHRRVDYAKINYSIEDGLVIGIIQKEPYIQQYSAYWENYTMPALPTREEAVFLLDQVHAKFRSYATDGQWKVERSLLEPPYTQSDEQYRSHPEYGLRAYAMQAVTWNFGALHCRPAES